MQRRNRLVLSVVVLGTIAFGLLACGDDNDSAADSSTAAESGSFDEATAKSVVEHYADGVYATYQNSLEQATTMKTAIDAFVAAPSQATLDAAKQAWIDARDDYGISEAFRFYGGPIDDENTGPEGQINAWPLDEAYIDYVEGKPDSGMIADVAGTPEITADVLAGRNEEGGETNIATGWHAVEFLLWGQDLSATGAGTRPFTDYTTAANAVRRATYLSTVTQLLIDDLTSMSDAWDPDGTDTYREQFLAEDPADALTKIITGIGELGRGELAGERMNVAYEERDQENEHSCFSDNTTSDLVANEQGIINIWKGTYPGGVTGDGLEVLVTEADSTLATDVDDSMTASLAEIEKIPAPFDQSLTQEAPDDGPGRTAIKTSIDELGTQTDNLVAAAKAMGLTIEVT